jgi:adenylyltransferase/sulfurtransferase
VGAGGLGCPALYALAPALLARGRGVAIVDDDRVDVSNLQRQILHRTVDVGRQKVDSARDALGRRWPELGVETHALRVDADNAARLFAGYALVLDGTDGVATKMLINDACVAVGVPLVHGGALGLGGLVMPVVPGSACVRCLFEAPPEELATCQEAGVLGAAAGVLGALMAEAALAILDGRPAELVSYDARTGMRRRPLPRPRAGCSACGLAARMRSA